MIQHAVIVGASDGIGLQLARQLTKKGVVVTCLSRTPCPLNSVNTITTDAARFDNRTHAADCLKQIDPPPDALVYAAGTSLCAPVETTTDADYRYLWEVDFFGFAHLTACLLPLLRQTKGRIVAIGSMAAVAPIPFDAHYSAAKNALIAFTQALANEVAPHGVRVSVVLPGGTKTAFTFKRKIYAPIECGCYAHAAQNAASQLACIEQKGMSPERVAQCIGKILTMEHPPLVAPVGLSNCAVYALCKSMPGNLTGNLIGAIYSARP